MPDPAPSVVSDAPNEPVRESKALEDPATEADFVGLEERVDHVLSDHVVVEARLESELRETLRDVGFTEPVGRSAPPKVTRRSWDPREVHVDEATLADRRRRQEVLRDLRPEVVRPNLDEPLVTRAGVFYVAPEFFQAVGIDQRMDADLLRAGMRSVRTLIETPDSEIAHLTGLSLREVALAKDDLDLTRLPGVDESTADLLRLAGVHSRSRLAKADPELLFGDIDRLRKRHRFFELPRVLRSEAALRTLIADAQGPA